MSSSLDSLINNLAKEGEQFFGFEEYNENQYKLLIKKGVYPYEYMNDWDKFKENELPPEEVFFVNLTLIYMGYFDNPFYMGGQKAPWSNSGISLPIVIKLGIIIL